MQNLDLEEESPMTKDVPIKNPIPAQLLLR
jgi:hypothetical protein